MKDKKVIRISQRWIEEAFEHYAANISKILDAAIKRYAQAARKTELVLGPVSKTDLSERTLKNNRKEHKMSEDHLRPDDKRLLGQQMKGISGLTVFSEQDTLPKLRAKIVSLASEYNYSVLEFAYVVYCLVSSGISGPDTQRALQLVAELSHDAEISPRLAMQILTTLINGGLMGVEKSDEVAKRILVNLARRGFQLPEG